MPVLVLYHTRAASARLADVRLGSAHARDDRGCTTRQIEAVNATVLPSDILQIKEKENTGNVFHAPATTRELRAWS